MTPDQTQKRAAGFSRAERAAMKERARELREGKGKGKAAQAKAEADLLARIAGMTDEDRALAERVHAIVTTTAPELAGRTWYGMPAYTRDGKVVIFFKDAGKFESRYATLGFEDSANLDDGHLWPTSYALTGWSDAVEEQVTALVKRAVS